MPGSTSSATPGWRRPTRSTSSSSTPRRRWSPSSRRRSSSTRRRSTMPAPFCPTPTWSRRSRAAPASAWSTRATWCARPTRQASSSSRSCARSRCSSACRSRPCPTSTRAWPKASFRRRAQSRRQGRARQGQGGGDRQPGRPDHRHGEDQGGISQHQPAALARPVHQCPGADRHAAQRGGGADRRHPARSQWRLRLRAQGRQHRHGAAREPDAARRRAGGGGDRPAGGRARGHHRLRPPHRGGPGRGLERGGCRPGHARRAAAPGPGRNPRHARARKADTDRGRTAGRPSMSVSSPFIHRPIAPALLGVAVMLGGLLGYLWLPVSSLPQVDFPTIQVTTQRPGASPDVMASLVTAPLERNFGQIPSMQLMTSSSSFGVSQVTLQFELNRDIDAAAQDVQAAINASGSVLPRNLPYPPVYSKVNPADTPMVTLAITSDTVSLRALSDIADTLLAQRLSELTGVGRVTVQGNIRPAIRIQADLSRLANYGIALEDMRNVIMAANVAGPKGALDGAHQSYTIAANDQLTAAEAYRNVIIAYRNSAPVLLRDVADVVDGLENARVGGFYQGTPAIVVDIQRQPGANVIETVQRIKNELPKLQRSMPVGAKLIVVHDATASIRAS